MKYKKASEIVAEALQLANISNSSAFSHTELENYLNDGFISLYNELAKAGNDYWLKEARVAKHSDSYFLPDDCYIIKQVYGKGSIPIPRASNTADGYRVSNGELLGKNIQSILYYPNPIRLTYPASSQQTTLNIYRCFENFALLRSGEIVDISTNETLGAIDYEDTDKVQLGRDIVLINGQPFSFSGDELADSNEWFLDAYGRAVKISDGKVVGITGAVYSLTDKTSGVFASIINDEMQVIESIEDVDWIQIAQVNDEILVVYENGTYNMTTDEFTPCKALARRGVCLYRDEYYYADLYLTETELTGYESDTLCNYPNNIFYRALAAYIAIQLLAKQNADISQQAASFKSLLDTLKSAKNASSDYPVIKQVY